MVAREFSPASLTDDVAVKVYRNSHNAGAKVAIHHRAARIGNAYPDKQSEAYLPELQACYFHVIGESARVVPCLPHKSKMPIDLRWDRPKDRAIANSFGASQRPQLITASASAFPLDRLRGE